MDWITAEHIGQLAVVILALGTFAKQYADNKNLARKDQLTQAEMRIAAQNERINSLERKLDREIFYRVKLMGYIGELQRIMRGAGLSVPPEPLFEDDEHPTENKTP
jgi:hypothetical protein